MSLVRCFTKKSIIFLSVLALVLAAALLITPTAHADTPITQNGSTEATKTQPVNKPTKAGWLKDADGTWYYFTSANGTPKTGWVKSGGKWYWLAPDQNGAMATNAWITDKNKRYYVDGNGIMETGWIKTGSEWYYANASGALKSGWQKSGGKWYWLQGDEQGLMAASKWITDKNKRYYLTSSGAMATKWIQIDQDWYYANNSGAQQMSGWVKSGSKWYWLDASQEGKMATNAWVTDKGKRYYLDGNGAMATKWIHVGNDWYYANKSGALQNGWVKSGGKWYWLQADKQGLMAADENLTIGGALYSFTDSGAMRTNAAIDLENNGYGFASSSGAITKIGEYVDGKVVLKNANGNILTGWQKLAGKWFYGETDTGIMHTGWLELGSTWYYLDPSGAMATGTRTIDGKSYSFSSSGAWTQITGNASLDSRIIKLAKQQGSLRNCFNWVKNHKHTNWAAGGGVLRYANGTHALSTSWVGAEAQRMLDGKTTDCYAFAACFACLAKALGYDAKVVNGYVPSRSQGWASHSWVEIKQGGTTYVYDPDLGRSIPSVNFYGFTYGSAPTNYKK